ncbi:MAG: hypothetical protein QOF48_2898 [Verrucomicrobiota bacterium]|jgi:predicted PurR-regulated permease PerM
MSLPSPSAYQARILWLALTGLALALILALIVGFVWGLGQVLDLLSPVLWPLAVAGVLAYLLDPVVDFFERKGVPRTRSILLVFVIAIGMFLAMLCSILPQAISESRDLATRIPDYAEKVWHRADAWVKNPPDFVRRYLKFAARDKTGSPGVEVPVTSGEAPATPAITASTNAPAIEGTRGTNGAPAWSDLFGKMDKGAVASWAAKSAGVASSWVFGQVARVASFFGLLAGLALVPVYAFYFLLEKKGIEKRWTDYLPLSNSSLKDELVFVLRSINDCLIAFFRSQVLVAICDGVLYTIGFLIVGLPYAVLLGVMATVLTMIPFLGAMATCTTALVIAFAQGDWKHPLGVLGVFAVVQTLEGFVIQPKIMGDRIGLHPLTVIVALMVGTTLLGGILGGLLAIPLTAAGRVLMFRYVWKRRDGKPAEIPGAARS